MNSKRPLVGSVQLSVIEENESRYHHDSVGNDKTKPERNVQASESVRNSIEDMKKLRSSGNKLLESPVNADQEFPKIGGMTLTRWNGIQ